MDDKMDENDTFEIKKFEEHIDYTSDCMGSTNTNSIICSLLREENIIMLRDRPCKIVDISTTSISKLNFVGIDLFTGKRYEETFFPNNHLKVPKLCKKKEYKLNSIGEDGHVILVDEIANNEIRSDLMLPDYEIGKEIKEHFEANNKIKVTVISTMGEEGITSYRIAN